MGFGDGGSSAIIVPADTKEKPTKQTVTSAFNLLLVGFLRNNVLSSLNPLAW